MRHFRTTLAELIVHGGLAKSKSEARRLIGQGAVKILNEDGTVKVRPRNPTAFVRLGELPNSKYLGIQVIEVDKSVLTG